MSYPYPNELDADDFQPAYAEMNKSEILGENAIYRLGAQADLIDHATRRILGHFQSRFGATDKAAHLLDDNKFRRFIHTHRPSNLLIRDEGQRPGKGYLAVSFLMAILVRELRSGRQIVAIGKIYTLAFFCSVATGTEGAPNARNIMMQLISQLMLQYPGLTRSVLTHDLIDLKREDTDGLFKLFERLVLSLPSRSHIYCIIDAFDPSPKADPENEKILASLVGLTKKSSSSDIIVKVLFTCSKLSVGFRRHLRVEEILNMGSLKSRGAGGSAHLALHRFHPMLGVIEKLVNAPLVRWS